jgi:cytochrome c oxidase subunit 3
MAQHPTPVEPPAGHGDQPRFLAHHFDTPGQQFTAGKLGMWIFLVTEILLFGGLFCWYAVYRSTHPEIFEYAHRYLDKTLGAINTLILITSSLTMAWGVRCAQLGHRRLLVLCLALTLAGGSGFLGIKYVEYRQKWREGLLWASRFNPKEPPPPAARVTPKAGPGQPRSGGKIGVGSPVGRIANPSASSANLPDGLAIRPTPEPVPQHVGLFFSIYFMMTGLHGIHVIAGMTAIGWILVRSIKGHFGPQYFGPVDYVGLYWHLVDLVWIFLFPLLYLIH